MVRALDGFTGYGKNPDEGHGCAVTVGALDGFTGYGKNPDEGHGFSRAVKGLRMTALDGMRRLASPEAKLSIRTQGCKRRPALKKSSKTQLGGPVAESKPAQVVGLDLGDRHSHYCMLTGTGEAVEEGRIQTTVAAMEKHFASEPRMRIALEAGKIGRAHV